MRIVIVEDRSEDRMLLKRIIEQHGHKVFEARDGRVALNLIREEKPDLVISDLLMPELDGFGLLRELHKSGHLQDVPFVVYSSIYTDNKERELAYSLGASKFLVKPLSPDDLWKNIEQVLPTLTQNKATPRLPVSEEEQLLREYSMVVASKLEAKVQELEETQKVLAAKERQYKCLFSSMDDVILLLNDKWQVLDANQPALRNQLGLELEDIVGHDLCSFFRDGMEYEDLHDKICKSGSLFEEGFEVQTHFVRKDKTVLICHISLSRFVNEQDEAIGVIAVIRDVTEKVESEAKLRQAQQEWEKTFDPIDDIVTLQGADMRINRINAAGLKMFQQDLKNIVGLNCYELFRETNEPCPDCPVTENLNDFVAHTFEVFHEKLQKTFLVSATPIFNESGGVTGIAHFAKDITERISLEKQLRQTQKLEAIGTLAGGIAHDFNNILSAIFGYTQLLQMELGPDPQMQSDVEQILKASNRAKDLVQQILTFSRSGEQKREPLRVQSIVEEALKLLRASIPSNIEIRQQLDEECPEIVGDATQIHQVIMNLCTNAYHAMMDREGVLSVHLSQKRMDCLDFPEWPEAKSGSYLELEVRDTGSGIESKHLVRIFEPYFTTKETGKGTGLGLSVVHGIVKSHGGHIYVYSEPGEGTLFRVYLPVCEKSADEKIDMNARQPVPHGHERILVVDDEEFLTKVQQRGLESLGYAVTAFTSSVDALDAFRSKPEGYDLIITDMTMPGLNGLELAKQILMVRKDMPVIMCSGFSDLINDKRLKEAGIRFFMMKPMDREVLGRKVREVLDLEK
ncbi:MAG: response regulator [Desulfobulbaceae bacterium]|uniref:histidine kinase n=1 Tax=Candidatus Desulfobia pelagia TaxID=2841692 RepID=A0A8J6TG85_9BACT|nr:response regulator [Candidatus Desulfobia pelagia]